MDKKMGATIRIHSFIPSEPKARSGPRKACYLYRCLVGNEGVESV